MRPKYTEKFKQGVTIGALAAASIALNGCDDSNNSDNKVETPAPTTTTAPVITKEVPLVFDLRSSFNACLAKTQHTDTSQNAPLKESPGDLRGYGDMKALKLCNSGDALHVNLNDCGKNLVIRAPGKPPSFCDDENADGKWEQGVWTGDFERWGDDSIYADSRWKATDESENPETWKMAQNRCNEALDQCLDGVKIRR